MIEKQVKQLHLPKIIARNHTVDSIDLKKVKSTDRASLNNYLQEVRLQQLSVKKWQEDKRQLNTKRLEKNHQLYQQIARLQVKKYEESQRVYRPEDDDIYEDESLMVTVFKHDTVWKPPHRYKTAMAMQEDQILIYGGFGPQQYMSLARFSIKNQEWQIPKLDQKKDLALYSHTMATFRGHLYIFGGIKMDSPSNQLLQLNLKTQKITQLALAPFRRRDHAMVLINRFLVVHGGVQGENQIKNSIFYFDTDSGRWNVPSQYQMPFLSHHSMVAVPMKTRKKQCTFQEAVSDSIYLFGGKNQKEASTNRLCHLKVRESGDMISQDVFSKGVPYPRHSACTQFIQPYYICVYGGKSDDQSSGKNLHRGIFNDLALFHVDKKQWITPCLNLQLPFRYGVSSCSWKNRLFFFGGSECSGYSDGNIVQLLVGKEGEEEEGEEGFKRGKLRG